MSIIELSFKEGLDHHWLHYDRTTGHFIRLWLRSRDFEGSVSEYYFEQGYLKITESSAIFIEKFNFQQHSIRKAPVGARVLKLVEQYVGVKLNEYSH